MSTNFFLSVVLTECSQQFPASEVGLTELCQNMEEQNLFVPEFAVVIPLQSTSLLKNARVGQFFGHRSYH